MEADGAGTASDRRCDGLVGGEVDAEVRVEEVGRVVGGEFCWLCKGGASVAFFVFLEWVHALASAVDGAEEVCVQGADGGGDEVDL